MIIDLGPNEGRVMERIEFLGVHREQVGPENYYRMIACKDSGGSGRYIGYIRPVLRKLL